MKRYKTIHDTVHGSIKVWDMFLDILDSPEIQRLHNIHQLGLAYLVFPGANHTRLEHSLGVWHVSVRMMRELEIDDDDMNTVAAACLLHDVGHSPYSHTLEYITHSVIGIDHMEVTKGIVEGKYDILSDDEKIINWRKKRVYEVLDEYGMDKKKVASLIAGEEDKILPLEKFSENDDKREDVRKRFLYQIVHSSLDADQIDYLLRDAHYTGVAYGVIDFERILQTITVKNDNLMVEKAGIPAVEGILVARALMYSSVYFHKTVRIAECMLARAVERMNNLEMMDIQRMVDAELLNKLKEYGGFQREIALMLKYRKLFKKAYMISYTEMSDDLKERLLELNDWRKRKEIEDEICSKAGIPEGHVIVDLPARELLLSEPRMTKTDVNIWNDDDNAVKPLSKYSPLARALQKRVVPGWVLMVSTDAEFREKVRRISQKYFEV